MYKYIRGQGLRLLASRGQSSNGRGSSTSLRSVPPRQGRFRAFEFNGRGAFYVEGVYDIKNYRINKARWNLTRRASSKSRKSAAASTPSDDLHDAGPAERTRSKTMGSRKRARSDSDSDDAAQSSHAKRPRLARPSGNLPGPSGLTQEILDLLKPPRRVPSPEWACLHCGSRPNSRKCNVDCYTAFRATRFDPAAAKIQIRRTAPGPNSTGLGVFVAPGQVIAKGEWLGEYLGELLPVDALEAETSAYAFKLDGEIKDGSKPLTVDGATYGNWTRFVNSSCLPNVEALPEQAGKVRIVAFHALRDIHPGEQLLISYGTGYFKDRGMNCRCDALPAPHLPGDKPQIVVSVHTPRVVAGGDVVMGEILVANGPARMIDDDVVMGEIEVAG